MSTLITIFCFIAGFIFIPYIVGLITVLIGSGDLDLSDGFMNFWFCGFLVTVVLIALTLLVFVVYHASAGDLCEARRALHETLFH